MEGDGARMTDEQDIYLSDIIAALKRRKLLIFACIVSTTVIGLLYAVLSTPLYTASVMVRPLEIEQVGGLSALSSKFGGAAALAGIDLGGGSDRDEYLAILNSRALGVRFIEENNIAPILFPDRWDGEAGNWRRRGAPGPLGSFMRGVSATLADLSGDEGRHKRGAAPTMWQAYKVFNNSVRNINEDKASGLVTISFKTRNPELSARWANEYVAMANTTIRDEAILEASKALEYLNAEVQKASMSGLREALFSVIESQLKKVMFAKARPEYAFKVIDEAVIPEDRSHPKRGLVMVLAAMLGGIIGVFVALVMEGYRGSLTRNSHK